MKVHQLIFLIWGIVFVFWMVRQFQQHNKRLDD